MILLLRRGEGMSFFQNGESSSLNFLGPAPMCGARMRGRLMVGRQTLDLAVQVRILAPQPSSRGRAP